MKWISVKEKPVPTKLNGQEYGEFLALIENKYVVLMQHKFDDGYWLSCHSPAMRYDHQGWDEQKYLNKDDEDLPIENVTHWQPLPPLPEIE